MRECKKVCVPGRLKYPRAHQSALHTRRTQYRVRYPSRVRVKGRKRTDGARDRLFAMWFNSYEGRFNYTLSRVSLRIEETDYYASLLICNSNPSYVEVLTAFNDFIKEFPCNPAFITTISFRGLRYFCLQDARI